MKLGIMQPYFFPYLGYFSLIKHVDEFILFDEVQFIRHGWIERNRVLKNGEGWQYIRVPLLKHSRETKIKEIQIDNSQNWKELIIAQLQHYKKKAPYFSDVMRLLIDIFNEDYFEISHLNKVSLDKVCEYLEINIPITIFTEKNLQIETITAADEWALNTCKELGADSYWNLPGGLEFFDRNKYEEDQISISFIKINLRNYDQKRSDFFPGLSIIDVMMFNGPIEINRMLDDYILL